MLMSEHEKLKFRVLHDRMNQEQTLFWYRFTAFSALHAALLVVMFTQEWVWVNRKVFAFAAYALGLAWFLIQWASLYYVDWDKGTYYDFCRQLEIPERDHWLFKEWFSSTNIGFYVSIIALLFWMHFLGNAFYSDFGYFCFWLRYFCPFLGYLGAKICIIIFDVIILAIPVILLFLNGIISIKRKIEAKKKKAEEEKKEKKKEKKKTKKNQTLRCEKGT